MLAVKPYEYVDVLDIKQLDTVVVTHEIDRVVHFSALLSAVAENNVPRALQVGGACWAVPPLLMLRSVQLMDAVMVLSKSCD